MFSLSHSIMVSYPILTCLLGIIVFWYLNFLWSRRRLYYYGSKVRGPISFPFIGTLHKFIFADGFNVLNILDQLADYYSGFYRLWLGLDLRFIVTIPEYIETILTSQNALDKSEDYVNFHPAVGRGLFTAPSSTWKSQRKVFSSFLSRKNLNDYMKTSVKFAVQTVNNIKKELENGREVDVEDAVAKNAMNTTLEVLFDERPELLNSEFITSPHGIERVMDVLFQRIYIFYYRFNFLFTLSKSGKPILSLINSSNRMVDQVIPLKRKEIYQKENISEKSITTTEPPTLMSYLLTEFKESSQDLQIRNEIITFIIASSDTGGRATNFMLLILGLFPDIQENIYQEVLQVFGKSDSIDWKKIHEMKYLDRVFKETLRLFPVAPLIGRSLTADIELGDGTILPKGSSAFIPILYIHRSEKYWPDPLKFDPDRFLSDNMTGRPRCAYIPFSYGPRNCVGMLQGQMAVKTNIAHLVRDFHVTTDYKSIEEIDLQVGILLGPKNGFKLHLQLRND